MKIFDFKDEDDSNKLGSQTIIIRKYELKNKTYKNDEVKNELIIQIGG